ncbi:hypothetical protein J2Z65_001494 [Paenibacillus aceris]|uniref:Uncharacterized protein n=1 Tax=Paenibacillus aceris TaxID=869555 RepID=A0ABS4HUR5_9BACL|nr:hypothetical protein [Paenibacillus aceris]
MGIPLLYSPLAFHYRLDRIHHLQVLKYLQSTPLYMWVLFWFSHPTLGLPPLH